MRPGDLALRARWHDADYPFTVSWWDYADDALELGMLYGYYGA